MMEGVGVEVLGIPSHLSNEQTIDKLTIHFLRKCNGGGEVQRVIYPSHDPGQAIVIFEEPNVASHVLKQTHVVDFGHGHRALVEVRAADRPEVDMPVKTYLDLSMFPNSSEVWRLLESHGFQVKELGRERLYLTGSFMKLTALKAQLERLLQQDTQTPKNSPSTSSTINGHGDPHGAVSKHCTSGSSARVGSRSPALLSDRYVPSSSPIDVSSRTSGPLQSISSPPGHVAAQSPRDQRSRGESSFIVGADVLHYAQCLRHQDIQMILEANESEMETKAFEGSDLCQVTVIGRGWRAAKQKLQSVLSDLTFALRTQDIPLAMLDNDSRLKVELLIQAHQDTYPLVVIKDLGHSIHLTGPSADSYDLKQILLGKPISPKQTRQRGRLTDRGSNPRRSSSLPRMRTKDTTQGAFASGASAQSDAHRTHRDTPQSSRAAQGAVAEPTGVHSVRGRSHSVSREKERDARKPEAISTARSSEVSSPRQRKLSLVSLFKKLTKSEMKQKLNRNSKMPESSS